MKSYSELLQHPKWQKKALHIKERDQFACRDCGAQAADGIRLDVHHCIYIHGRKPWDYEDEVLLTVCHEKCHPRRQQLEIAARIAIARELAKWPIERLERAVWYLLEQAFREAA